VIVGNVLTEIHLTNARDLDRVDHGELSALHVRRLMLEDVLVDTGATTACLKSWWQNLAFGTSR
jgi:hypothetical protein